MIVIKEQLEVVFRNWVLAFWRRKCYFCSDVRLPKASILYADCSWKSSPALRNPCISLPRFWMKWNGICMTWFAMVCFWLTQGRLSSFEINSTTGADRLAGSRQGEPCHPGLLLGTALHRCRRCLFAFPFTHLHLPMLFNSSYLK